MTRVVFRTLPGIAEIERLYIMMLENKLMKDETEALERAIDDKSLELFGITDRDTQFWSLPAGAPDDPDEWETHFEFLEWAWDEESEFWDVFAIDVTDDDGDQLHCMDVFGRQLVCALKRIHPAATLTFQRGSLSDDQLMAAAEVWGRRLRSAG